MSVLNNVRIYYPKLDPANPDFGMKDCGQWSVQARTEDAEEAAAWKDMNLNVIKAMEKDEYGESTGVFLGYWKVTFSTRARSAEGKEMRPPRVVDGEMFPIDGATIGNGSLVNIQYTLKEYKIKGRTTYGNHLNAIQVLELVEFNGACGLGFTKVGPTKIIKNSKEEDEHKKKKDKGAKKHEEDEPKKKKDKGAKKKAKQAGI